MTVGIHVGTCTIISTIIELEAHGAAQILTTGLVTLIIVSLAGLKRFPSYKSDYKRSCKQLTTEFQEPQSKDRLIASQGQSP